MIAVDCTVLLAEVRRIIREELAAVRAEPAEFVSTQEYAASRGIRPSTVRSMIHDGRIAPAFVVKVGKVYRVRRDARIDVAPVRPDSPAGRAARIAGGGR